MIRVVSPNPRKFRKTLSKQANKLYRGVLIYENTKADPVVGNHATASIYGVVVHDQLAANKPVIYQDVSGEVLEIDVYTGGTKKTFADSDIGSTFDIKTVENEHFIDPDDTTTALFILVGYDNYRAVAYVTVPQKYMIGDDVNA